MIYLFKPEITISGRDMFEILTKADKIRQVLALLQGVDDIDIDLTDDTCMEQLDPDLELPLAPQHRAAFEEAVAAAIRASSFGDGLEDEYAYSGICVKGPQEMSEVELLQELLDLALDEDDTTYLLALPYLEHHNLIDKAP